MKVTAQPHGHVTVLLAHGPLVGDDALDLKHAVENARASQATQVVLDLHEVPYLDSAGIEMLLELCNVTLSPYARPRLAALSEAVFEALELTDALSMLEVFDSVENALRSCQR